MARLAILERGEYLAALGHSEAARIWREYPILDYGKGWDGPDA